MKHQYLLLETNMDTTNNKCLVDGFLYAYGGMKTASTSCIVFIMSAICPE